jgi:plasmid replication initiation protein
MRKKQAEIPRSQVQIIRKANELVEARYRFDIWEMRVFAKMLMSIEHEDKDFSKYNIHINELLRDFNLVNAGDNYTAVKEAVQKLQTKIIEIEKDTPEGVKWFSTPLLISTEGFKNTQDGNYISVQFHPTLKPFLIELKERYLQYDISNLWGLSSMYSIRIYELLKQYERIGKRHFDVENLRVILGLEETEYKLYGHFKDKIVLKAQRDLLEVTDISFTFTEVKKGRKVVGLTFFITTNTAKKTNRGLSNQAEKRENLKKKTDVLGSDFFKNTLNQVKTWGVSETTFRVLVIEHGEEQVQIGLECTLDAIKSNKITGNAGGFFCKAVEEKWQSSRQISSARQADKQKIAADRTERVGEEQEKWEQLLSDLQTARSADAREMVRELTHENVHLADAAVAQLLKDKTMRGILERTTGLTLANLEMEDWRQNKDLRNVVIGQIELMHPENFLKIQNKYDKQIKQVRQKIEALKP